MPKTDPITGCHVITPMEFFAAEVEREGKEVADIVGDLLQSIDDDAKRWENDLCNDVEDITQEI